MAIPVDLETPHRSFVRSLRAEDTAPRTIEASSLAVDRFAEHLRERPDPPKWRPPPAP